MSFSFAVNNGDLVIKGSSLAIVYGVELLKQNIDLWLRERFGTDRFHPTMGSTLEDFIGEVVTNSTRAEIYSEVLRILENYLAIQTRIIKQNPQKLSLTEILVSINSIDVKVNFDTVFVTVSVSNAAGQTTVINASQTV